MGQRKKVRPGDREYRAGWLGEVWIEWGEGKVLDEALPPGRVSEIETRPAHEGRRNAVLVVKPQHLEHPMAITVDTHDRGLPAVVRYDPCALIGHTIGYRAVVRRTQAFVRAAPGNLDTSIDRVRGSEDGQQRYKVRELIEVVEIDERDPRDFEWTPPGRVVNHEPASYEPRTLEGEVDRLQAERARGRQRSPLEHLFGAQAASVLPVEAKLHAMHVADNSLKSFARWLAQADDPGDNYGAWREFVFVCVERVLALIEGDFDEQPAAFRVACDLIEGALACYLPRAHLPLDEQQLTLLEGKLVEFAGASYRQLSAWEVH